MPVSVYPLLRAILFRMDAEAAHELTLGLLGAAPRLWSSLLSPMMCPPPAPRVVGGVPVRGPVGLAAGLDKDGRAIPVWSALGFGFVEVGTVTMHAQEGNPRPRLFRLVDERAVVNRMGFNNRGSQALADRLRALREEGRWPAAPVGANLGKSKVTALDDAVVDYVTSTERLRGLVDWFTINVSSPNTPGLRELQDGEALRRLLPAVVKAAEGTPVWLKLAPDLGDDALASAVHLARESGIRAVVATNTTIRRDVLTKDPQEAGGLSGRPLRAIAQDRVKVVVDAAKSDVDVIGVGGIESAAHAEEYLALGCAAVQLYTAFIYEGPALPGTIQRELLRRT